jgi:glycosyltransferase involved in cell wall biosynthesis
MVFKPFCKKIIFHATSEHEKFQIKKLFKTNPIFVCQNLPTLPNKSSVENVNFKKKKELRVLYLSRICKNKNLLFAIETLSKTNVENKIIFNIVGPAEDINYWKKCQSSMRSSPKNINFNYIGPQPYEDACQNYLNNDLFFLPTLFENFGHVIYESLLYGCPVLISNNTPFENGEFETGVFAIDLLEQEVFVNTINKICDMTAVEHKELRDKVRKNSLKELNIPKTLDDYKKMFSALIY